MGLHRDIYAERSNLVPAEFLQSLFVAELILPKLKPKWDLHGRRDKN